MQASYPALGRRTASTPCRFSQRRGAAACRPLSHRRVVAYSAGNAATAVREAVLCKKFKAHDASTSAALVVTDEPGEVACSAPRAYNSCRWSGLTCLWAMDACHRPEEDYHLILGQDTGHMDAGRGEQQLQPCSSLVQHFQMALALPCELPPGSLALQACHPAAAPAWICTAQQPGSCRVIAGPAGGVQPHSSSCTHQHPHLELHRGLLQRLQCSLTPPPATAPPPPPLFTTHRATWRAPPCCRKSWRWAARGRCLRW
jgi:hypothetical protein